MVSNPQVGRKLPVQPTSFVGRESELDDLKRLLADPACRLLTLTGPGGSGKTRLAIEAAQHMLDHFPDGISYSPLESISSTDFFVSTIADSLGFSLRGHEETVVQLSNYLGNSRLLMVLDNFEHLLPAADFLSDLLSTTSGTKFLITSREALNLREEWVYTVDGMRFPSDESPATLEDYDSVRLFVEHARRVQRDFSLDADRESIGRICQHVQGMPLGIELAASWLKLLPCEEIANEIDSNLDFLNTSLRNVPERHRSMRAVFDESWKILDETEREVFKRLSVFQGSFQRNAAQHIAGAALQTLSSLIDKSLLRQVSNNRYQIHELLRQYADEKLAESPGEASQTRELYCKYYADFVEQLFNGAMKGQQLELAANIQADIENVREAWNRSVDDLRIEEMGKMTLGLTLFCQYRSRYTQGATALEMALNSLGQIELDGKSGPVLALNLVQLAWLYIRLGRFEETAALITRCEDIYSQLKMPIVHGWTTDPCLPLGVLATIQGNYAEAERCGKRAQLNAEIQDNPWNMHLAFYVLTRAALLQGQFERAKRFAEQAYQVSKNISDTWFMAYCLIELGNVASAMGDYRAAKGYYQASYDVRLEFEDAEGMAIALTYLGGIALKQQSYQEANALYQQSIALYQEINDIGGLASSYAGLANAAVGMKDYDSAKRHFRSALEIAASIRFLTFILSALPGIADMLIQTGQTDDGLAVASLASRHAASDHETRSSAQQLVSDQYEHSAHDAESIDTERVVSIIQQSLRITADIGILSLLERPTHQTQSRSVGAAGQSYPDELTEREVEVLRLIAQGKSNRDISGELFITTNTVANHVKNILSKTGSSNRTEAAAYAILHDLN